MEQGHSRGAHGVMWSAEARRGLSGQRNGDARRHAADDLCCRSAMTELKLSFQCSSSLTDRRILTPINS